MRLIGNVLTLSCLLLVLSACGGNDNRNRSPGGNGDDSAAANLPKPETAGGSVTGMPDTPGPGQVGPPPAATDDLPPDTPVASDGSVGIAPGEADGMPGSVEPSFPGNPDTALGEPTPQDAVAVVHDYYAAIDAYRYGNAYALWSGGGNASGQTPQQFADGFADTAEVTVRIDAPGRVDPAAGSRYIEIPVAIRAVRRDGNVHQYVGSYTLRRAVVDGATADQRAWRIASADLREVRP